MLDMPHSTDFGLTVNDLAVLYYEVNNLGASLMMPMFHLMQLYGNAILEVHSLKSFALSFCGMRLK